MASVVNVHDAKTHFSKLLSRIHEGEEIVIAKSGVPVAKLVPIEKKIEKRVPNTAKGKVSLTFDFQAEISDEGREEFEQ